MQGKKIGAVEAEKYSMSVTARQQKMIEDEAEKDRGALKKTILVIEGIKNNMVALKRVSPLANKSNLILPGHINNNMDNEDVFEVIAVGNKTDEYTTDIEVGQKVMVSNLIVIKFKAATDAKLKSGEYAGILYMCSLNDIQLIVDYKIK